MSYLYAYSIDPRIVRFTCGNLHVTVRPETFCDAAAAASHHHTEQYLFNKKKSQHPEPFMQLMSPDFIVVALDEKGELEACNYTHTGFLYHPQPTGYRYKMEAEIKK